MNIASIMLRSSVESTIAFFYDPKNRDAAIKIMADHSKMKPDDVAKSYEFLRSNNLFEPGGKVSKTKMTSIINSLKSLGDVQGAADPDRFVMPGVTQLAD
jgi:NitT/TauT family transport system substrate-binding protein